MACCSSTSNSPGAGAAATDTCKRVNYTLGMLMGVDDFVQDQLYDGSRRRELARELLGYGTVHGLDIVIEADGDKGPRLRVTPGMAWLPSGTPVCVDSDQCANLNDWLSANAAAVQAAVSASPPGIAVYVVLSYVQCLTDNVPIPGEPCRSDDELMAPSRIADSFRLELRLAPPNQREEDALRDFVEWLLSLPLSPSSPPLDEAGFTEAVRAAAMAWLNPSSPPTSPPDYMTGMAPAGTSEALFRSALRLWVTELRPLWMARADCSCNAAPIPPADDAVLLAQLDLSLVATGSPGTVWQLSDLGSGDGTDAVAVDQSRRPVLLSLRMLQELVLRRWETIPGNTVVAETLFGQSPDAGFALSYSRSDHTHGSPDLPALGGDLSGPLDDARIESLQGVPLAASSPLADGQVLTYAGGMWVPAMPVSPPAPIPAPAPPAGQFVDRGTADAFQIVSAADIRIVASNRGGVVKIGAAYGKVDAKAGPSATGDLTQLLVTVNAGVTNARKLPNYIVKLTPIWVEGAKVGFRVYLNGTVTVTDVNAISFQVLVVGDSQISDGSFPLGFQFEVSRF